VEIRHLDEEIAELRRREELAIDVGDYHAAAALRHEEKEALARRGAAVEAAVTRQTESTRPASDRPGQPWDERRGSGCGP
jgi:hypothetical protein